MTDVETITSILCGPPGDDVWHWDTVSATSIQFKPDGTGRLVLAQELNLWIACPFTYTHTPSSPQTTTTTKPTTPLTTTLNLTLHPTKLPTLDAAESLAIPPGRLYNADLLHPSTFAPHTRTIAVSLEKGRFQTQFEQRHRDSGVGWPEFEWKVRFEPSVFPGREAWREARGAPDAMRFWTWDEFYRGRVGVKGDGNGGWRGWCGVM
ncbi:hypothetical protein EJ05DRAFT_506388 [Pseudovirgaria hyperparasitica]|uniref:Uncharacterized protein n=1 Tax=Pseudovirgaria hyperparasitica TaxID=470096 RepID=A0A6A6WKK0_9PEZI|nr:uncharacterized protein EJ05DRAFT_506388 [Pseudovirgaria hyperparasitica]KAF2762697.1 hypothetical protein EJ05DRAFT_506388 [Pseudovirgaria hyperparasitica]